MIRDKAPALLTTCIVATALAAASGCCAESKMVYFERTARHPGNAAMHDEVKLSCPLLLGDHSCAGFKYIHNEQWDTAAEYLEEGLVQDDNAYFNHLALGVCYEKLGDFERAFDHYQKANWEKQTDEALAGYKRVQEMIDIGAPARHSQDSPNFDPLDFEPPAEQTVGRQD